METHKNQVPALAGKALNGEVQLPVSKSESNRALILAALSNGLVKVKNPSDAEDTRILQELLASDAEVQDVGDAGTVMRFLTAFYAFRQRDVMLTGSARMCERPVAPLVNALRELGADIFYPGKEGFPPLAIYGRNSAFGETRISIPGNISSQFISALLMVGAGLPDGIEIHIEGELTSAPYVRMTLQMMEACSIRHQWNGNIIRVERQHFSPAELVCEADWSAAAYFYFLLALAGEGKLLLKGLRENSLQGDAVIAQLMKPFGVKSTFLPEGVLIEISSPGGNEPAAVDFKSCPDLAQGFIVFCAAKGKQIKFTGLESLRIKETDRIAALDAELKKAGCGLAETSKGEWEITGRFHLPAAKINIGTWGDHRMAMAFSQLLVLTNELEIENPGVVKKSFPGFWRELDAIAGNK